MNRVSRQCGYITVSTILIIGLFGFAVLAALKVVPIYLDHYGVVSVMEGVVNDDDVGQMSRGTARERIAKRLGINNIRQVDASQISFERGRGLVRLSTEYEVRVGLIANIDVVVSFSDAVEKELP